VFISQKYFYKLIKNIYQGVSNYILRVHEIYILTKLNLRPELYLIKTPQEKPGKEKPGKENSQ